MRLSATYRFTSGGDSSDGASGISVELTHVVHVTGSVSVFMTINASRSLPPLPRVGLQMCSPNSMRRIEWFGRGPNECYPDRKTAAMMGRYVTSVDDMHVPYIIPGENSGRSDVSWMALRCATSVSKLGKYDAATAATLPEKLHSWTLGPGVVFAINNSEKALITVQRHSLNSLEKAVHTHELDVLDNDKESFVHVHIDHVHMGVGGDDSWTPSVHPEFTIQTGREMAFGITIAALPREGDPFEVYQHLQRQGLLQDGYSDCH